MTAASIGTPWVDEKRLGWILSPLLPALALGAMALFQWTGFGIFLWGGPILVHAVIPLADWIIGTDRTNPPESAVASLENQLYYRIIVFCYVPLQFAVTIWGAWMAVNGGLAGWELIGLMFSVGTINGIAINTAHELGHKQSKLERWSAKVTLAPVAYGHFQVEHPRGHHKNVATPEDPASSRMGETFWSFLPRSVFGSVRSAWNIEKQRLARTGKGVWTIHNENLHSWAMSIVFFGAMTAWLGWPALLFLIPQAIYGFSLLEVVNYVEHYGLLRQKGPDGRYERCQPRHSWNSNNVVTNLFLYQLQRHSDHHANPTRRFQALRHFENSPQLPSGYATMISLAYFPALWFRVMDPRVVAHHKGDISKANLQPSRREELLARYPVSGSHDEAPIEGSGPSQQERVPEMAGATRFQCTDCGYIYDEAAGCPHEGFEPGTKWADIPDDWSCPDCSVRDKVDFQPCTDAQSHAA